MLSLVLGCMHQGCINNASRKTGRSSVKRKVDLSISVTLNLFSAFSHVALQHLIDRYPVTNRIYATDVPVLERTMESESCHTRCLLLLVWALHEVVEVSSIIFVKHIAILEFAERKR